MPERVCRRCGDPLPADAYRSRRYCARCSPGPSHPNTFDLRGVGHRRTDPALGGGSLVDITAYLRAVRADPCAYCGAPSEHYDHIDPALPRKRGRGAARAEWPNLAGACGSCNASKQRTPLLHYLLQRAIQREIAPLQQEYARLAGLPEGAPLWTRADGRVRVRSRGRPVRPLAGRRRT